MSNYLSGNVEDFFRKSVLIPYQKSIISLLTVCFSTMYSKAFVLMQLHPDAMTKLNKEKFLGVTNVINNLYGNILSPKQPHGMRCGKIRQPQFVQCIRKSDFPSNSVLPR